MKPKGILRFGSILAGLSAVAALAGCAGQPPAPREREVRVNAMERVRWDLPPEPGLFRMVFDEALSRELRRRASVLASQEDIDYHYAEIRVLEDEADRELKSRNLCGGTTAFLGRLDGGSDQREIGAAFKCRLAIF